MDVFPKFIIETDIEEGDCLIIAKCTFHKQLATDITKVKGGGWWKIDHESKVITLYGESSDFGTSSIENIKSCIERKQAYTNPGLYRNWIVDLNYSFKYQDDFGEIINL